MNAGKLRGGRRLAPLAGLALVAALLAAAPGAAQAQGTARDPLTVAPTITSAGPDRQEPHSTIMVVWQWAFPEDPNNPVRSDDDHDYRFDAQIASDQSGDPGDWFDHASHATLIVSLSVEADQATGVREVVLTGRLAHVNLHPGETFRYRVRARDLQGEGTWATVGPVSTESLPATPTPEDFVAYPKPGNPGTTAVLSWRTVPATDRSTVHYRLDRLNSEAGAWQRVDRIQGNAYEQVFTVSNEFTRYRLWAVRDYGNLGTVVSEMAFAVVTPSQPPPPTGVTAAKSDDQPSTTVVITWSAVPVEVGSRTLYNLRFRTASDGSAEWEGLGTSSAQPTTFYHHERAPATTYEYQVAATRLGAQSGRTSEWSESATVTTDADIGGL